MIYPPEARGTELTPGIPKPTSRPASQRAIAPANKIRPELTLEKWPAIWQPAKSHGNPVVRTFHRRTTLSNGTSGTATVEVGFTQLGNLTTEDQKTYYGLIKQWETTGKLSEPTFFSIRRLSRTLKKKWGTNVIQATTDSLRRLRTTPFSWANSFHDSATGEELEVLNTFTILADLKIVRRKSDGHVTKEAGYFRFHDYILKNLLAKHTKPLHLEVILGFSSEVAQLLYTHVDLMLAAKDIYERRSKELFEDLGLRSHSYRYPSNRRQVLSRALRELVGVQLSTGILNTARIDRTADGKDYKAVFRKTANPRTSVSPSNRNKNEPTSQNPVTDSPLLQKQASELVSHFHRLFHAVEKHFPSSKELTHAIALIAAHGFAQSKYVVDFSHQAASQTNYSPQTFGGILQYVSRALSTYEALIRQTDSSTRQLAEQQAQEAKQRQVRQDIDNRLARLPQDDYKALYEATRAELVAKYPRLEGNHGSLLEAAIRATMARQLKARETQNPAS